jgi:hypothetical protein
MRDVITGKSEGFATAAQKHRERRRRGGFWISILELLIEAELRAVPDCFDGDFNCGVANVEVLRLPFRLASGRQLAAW